MAKVTAVIESKSASLAEDFGYQYACRLFGKDVIDTLPKITRGKNKGKTRGYICWKKAIKGGWDYQYGVCLPGLVWATISENYAGNGAIRALWMGRVQELSGSRSVLGEEGRHRLEQDAENESLDLRGWFRNTL